MRSMQQSDTSKADTEAVSYQARLKLKHAPFASGRHEQFFADPQLIQRLELLQHIVQFTDLLMVVSGPEGSGKTMLLDEFSSRITDSWRVCRLDASGIQDRNTLLASIADGYEIDPISIREQLSQRLVNHWKALQLVGKYVVLIIDNAHCMDTPMLQTLLALDGSPRATLHRARIILAGEPGLVQRLTQDVFKKRDDSALVHNIELASLSEEQTNLYLAFRLSLVGYAGESPFSPHEVHSIHKVSAGRPGRINELAHQVLVKQGRRDAVRGVTNATSTRWFSWPVMRWGMAALAIAGLVAIGIQGWLHFSGGDHGADQKVVPLEVPGLVKGPSVSDDSEPQPSVGTSRITKELPVPPVPVSTPEPVSPPAADPVDVPSQIATPSVIGTAQFRETSERKPAPVADSVEARETQVEKQTVAPTIEPSATDSSLAGPAALTEKVEAQQTNEVVGQQANINSKEHAAPLLEEQRPAATIQIAGSGDVPQVPTNAVQKEITKSTAALLPQDVTGPESAVEPGGDLPSQAEISNTGNLASRLQTESDAPPEKQAKVTGRLQREDWIMNQDPNKFTLQLLSVRNEAALAAYAKEHKLVGDTAYFEKSLIGSNWYSLIFGTYASRQAAVDAGTELSDRLGGTQPWVRRLATIQVEIQRFRDNYDPVVP